MNKNYFGTNLTKPKRTQKYKYENNNSDNHNYSQLRKQNWQFFVNRHTTLKLPEEETCSNMVHMCLIISDMGFRVFKLKSQPVTLCNTGYPATLS